MLCLKRVWKLRRPKGSPSPPPKEQTSYWALPTPGGRWRTAGFNRLEDEDLGDGSSHAGPLEVGGGAEPASEQSAGAPSGFAQPGSTPSTPGSMKKQRSLKAAKPERLAARGNSLRMMPNFQLPNFNNTYSRWAFCVSMKPFSQNPSSCKRMQLVISRIDQVCQSRRRVSKTPPDWNKRSPFWQIKLPTTHVNYSFCEFRFVYVFRRLY